MFQEPTSLRRVYFFPMPDARFVLYLLIFSSDPALHGIEVDRMENALSRFAAGLQAPRIRAKPVGGEMPLTMEPERTPEDTTSPVAEAFGAGAHASLIVHGMQEGQPLTGTMRILKREPAVLYCGSAATVVHR